MKRANVPGLLRAAGTKTRAPDPLQERDSSDQPAVREESVRVPLTLVWPPTPEDLDAIEVFEFGDRPTTAPAHPAKPEFPSRPAFPTGGTAPPFLRTRDATKDLHDAPGELTWPPPDTDDVLQVVDLASDEQTRVVEQPVVASVAQPAASVAEVASVAPVQPAKPIGPPAPKVVVPSIATAPSRPVPKPTRERTRWWALAAAASAALLLMLVGVPFTGSGPWPGLGAGTDSRIVVNEPTAEPPRGSEPAVDLRATASPSSVADANAGGAHDTRGAIAHPDPLIPPITATAERSAALEGRPPDVRPAPLPSTSVSSDTPNGELSVPREEGVASEATTHEAEPLNAVPVPPPVMPTSAPPTRDEIDRASTRAAMPSLPAAAESTAAAPVAVDPQAEVREALSLYRAAYAGLDAAAARRVWPSVDQAALARAFSTLKSQRLEFDRCDIVTKGEAATAACQGRAIYVPQVGRQEQQVEPRTWRFTLRATPSGWRIDRAEIQR